MASIAALSLGLVGVPTAAARKASGTSPGLAWGYNSHGQLGNGKTGRTDVPVGVKLPKGTKLTAVAAGYDHTVAVTSTGSVLAWGLNASGELGDGSTRDSHVPVRVKLPKGTKVTAVAAGAFYSLAVTSSGSVLGWGYNSKGQLGDGKTTGSDVPVKVKLPKRAKVIAVAAGYYHSLAVTSTGSVLAWGANGHGQLGDGRTAKSLVPVRVKLPKKAKVTAVSAGGQHSLAVTRTGSVLAWGYNGHGELGDGKTTGSDVPVRVKLPKGTKVSTVAAGFGHSLAVTSTGAALAWGNNASGQLGDGTSKQTNVPVSVKLPTGTSVTALAAGYYHSLAVTSTGRVLAWGNNFYGQLGDGKTTGSNVPVRVKLPKGTTVSKVAAGHGHSVAL